MRKQEGSSIFLFIFLLPSLKNSLECVSLAGMGVWGGAGIRDQIENKPKEMFPYKSKSFDIKHEHDKPSSYR